MRAARSVLLATLVLALTLAGCGGAGTPTPAGDAAVHVVTTTTIFADLVAQVGGDRVSVESLVPKGGEVHTFDPRPSDVRRVTQADLVVLNGLGLDGWLRSLVEDAGTGAPVLALGEDLDGVTYLEDDGAVNPHLWLDVAYAARYATRIADALRAVDPAGGATYDANLAAYRTTLAELDAWAKAQLGAIPEADRTVVSFHDAFPYFAAAYGLTIDGSIVSAPGQDPSAGEVARLIEAVRGSGVRAIFAEAQFSDDLVRTIADETGAAVVSSLYTDSLGDAPADTYVGLMRWNVDEVVAALRG